MCREINTTRYTLLYENFRFSQGQLYQLNLKWCLWRWQARKGGDIAWILEKLVEKDYWHWWIWCWNTMCLKLNYESLNRIERSKQKTYINNILKRKSRGILKQYKWCRNEHQKCQNQFLASLVAQLILLAPSSVFLKRSMLYCKQWARLTSRILIVCPIPLKGYATMLTYSSSRYMLTYSL